VKDESSNGSWSKTTGIELLNTISYNYGKLADASNCCSLQENSNRLAVCTEKCIFIVNLNLNWPNASCGVTPAKFLSNQNKTVKGTFQIDSWVQDMAENRNELLYVNLIKSIDKSKRVETFYKEFFSIEESFKRKPFYRSIRDLAQANQSAPNRANQNLQIADSNMEQYLRHKQLIEQHKMYDMHLYDYLSYLNPVNNPNQVAPANPTTTLPFSHFHFGYKYCCFNTGLKTDLLCAITTCNQLLLFECTRLSYGHRGNVTNVARVKEERSNDDVDSLRRVFDSKSGAQMINLTELWLLANKASKPAHTINEHLERIANILPTLVCWSSSQLGELLFVALKSNKILGYIVSKDDNDNLQVELVYLLDMSAKLVNEEQEADEANVSNLFDSIDCRQSFISAMTFWQTSECGVLATSFQGGAVFLTRIDLKKSNEPLREIATYKLKNFNRFGTVETLQLQQIEHTNDLFKLLLIVKYETHIIFLVINYDLKQFSEGEPLFFYNQSHLPTDQSNFLVQNHSKLISVNLMDQQKDLFEFWLVFENSLIKYLKIGWSLQEGLTLLDEQVINQVNPLKFDTEPPKCDNGLFKMTRHLTLSANKKLLFQVNEFVKQELVSRKPTHLELNLYSLKPYDDLLPRILPSSLKVVNKSKVIDLIWLFKRQLYLNQEFFAKTAFETIYSSLKATNKQIEKQEELSDDLVAYLKRIRIVCFYLANYFEMANGFKSLPAPQGKEENDEDDDGMDESNEALPVEEDERVIRSAPYYWSMFNELTFCLYRDYSLRLVTHACQIGFEQLSSHERLIMLLVGEFSLKKNFFSNSSDSASRQWLHEHFLNTTASNELMDLINTVKCDFCGQMIRVDKSNELNTVECESGHVMNRCQKSLMPLDNFKFSSCAFCHAAWNVLDNSLYPNLSDQFGKQSQCLFCT